MARETKAKKTKKGSDKDTAKVKKSKASTKPEKETKKSKKSVKEEKPAKKTKSSKDGKTSKKAKASKEEKPAKKIKSKKGDEATGKEAKKSKRAKVKDEEVSKKSKKSDDGEKKSKLTGKALARNTLAESVGRGLMFNPYANIDSELDRIDKDLSLSGSSLNLNEQRMSTGLLGLDLVVGKGMVPGWYTFYGPEQSCKSTGAMLIMSSALLSNVPIKAYFDYEGSGEPTYIENMLETNGIDIKIEDVFGVPDPRTSKWIKAPMIRYQKPQVAERFFDYVFKLEKKLPDKVMVGDEWYYVYDDTKENRKLVGDAFDKNYWRKSKRLRVPAVDGTPQALIVVDSYPAMLPERLDDEDAGAGMAAQARMFSEQIKRIKGRLAAKRIIIVGVNQLRQRPAVMYGSPEYEPCGDALKFYSDCRLRFNPRALSGVPYVKGKGMVLEEKSATVKKGKDTYRFIHVRAVKNKLGMPYLESWVRLWIEDGNGEARGFDPVWDTFMYLDNTGQISHKGMKNIKLKINKHENAKVMDWMDFKVLIVGTKKQQKEVCERVGLKWFDLRAFCKDQLSNKDGMIKFIDHKKSGGEAEEGDDEDVGTPDADDAD